MPISVNTLILGQGLAGSLLSYELLRRGERILVVDDADPKSASRLAAGLISPISGQRSALLWEAAELLPLASDSYRSLEALLQERFFHPLPIRRYFLSAAHRHLLRSRAKEPRHSAWMGSEFIDSIGEGIHFLGGAWLDCALFLKAWRAYLEQKQSLEEAKLQREDWDALKEGRWRDWRFERAIFCCGVRAREEGPFSWLPFQATKGEVLQLESKLSKLNAIAYAEHYAIPLGQGQYRVGGSYARDWTDMEVSAENLEAFQGSAQKLLEAPFRVLRQSAGLRPNLLGHFPVLGRHPEEAQFFVFNGLGSKGAAWAPWAARKLAAFLYGESALVPELDLSRFSKFSSRS
jgi:glycine oxidase